MVFAVDASKTNQQLLRIVAGGVLCEYARDTLNVDYNIQFNAESDSSCIRGQ